MWALVTSEPEPTLPTLCHVAPVVSQFLEVTCESKVFLESKGRNAGQWCEG